MSHPKDTFLTNPSEIGKWVTEGLAKGAEEQQLANEVRMMQSERTPNELVEDELEIIERLAKRGEHK